MTDEDLDILLREEYRLYRVYVESLSEESRTPRKTRAKREAWVKLHDKLKQRVNAETRRRILQARVGSGEKRRKR